MDKMNTTAMAKFGDYTPNPRLRQEGSDKPWLDQLKIAHGVSQIVKDRKAQIGDYYVGDSTLGYTVEVVIGPSRPNAIWLDPENGWKPKLKSNDLDSDDYQTIKAAEAAKTKGAKTGPDFLLYLVGQQKFVTFHMTGMAKGEVDECYAALDRSKGQKIVSLGIKTVGKNSTPVPTFTVTDKPTPPVAEDRYQRALTIFTAFEQLTGEEAAGAGARPR